MAKKDYSEKPSDEWLVKYVLQCRQESDDAKHDREEQNEENYDMFHLRHDFSHKKKGQSREVLAKQRMAVIQIVSFFQQALADIGDWWRVEQKDKDEVLLMSPEEIQKLTNWQLDQNDYYSHVGNSVQRGLLQSLMITKTAGKLKPKTRYELKGKKGNRKILAVDDKTWRLTNETIPSKHFYHR